jgi:DNA-binding transcriptional LysR family regulator
MELGFTLTQLRYFAAAAEHLSMTAAARELHVSQSAVSTAVAQLERELSVQLLLRHHARGLTLTAAGRAFHQELRSFFAHGAELAEVARLAGEALVGDLALGCFTTLGPLTIPGLLETFAERYPNVRVTVHEAEHAVLKTLLKQARVELALMYAYDLDDDIDHVVVREIPAYVCLPAGHRLAARGAISLTELADQPMVLLDLPNTAAYLSSLVMMATGVMPKVRHRTAGFETVRAMVAHGHGYAVLNQRPVHDLTYDGARVVNLEITDPVPPLQLVAATMKGAKLTARARALIRTFLESQPPGSLRPAAGEP